ncbi:hypothetical protein [Achromobacter sp. MFA1 R4]|uniref:hypothetical protein n=1 Tax=Achromobacter sp. MFA1 R4 TaxID=1881016 RepID=UPI0009537B99|nr:hypothetical protein [Achromobacter sp. MFA1 R4]SIT04044.1 hypothetical protein SAMN05428937_0338 [Achromobacter sp. MFA1 R4]
MPRLAITRTALIPLFAKSGNVCAFPGCTHELVTARNLFVGQICHIEAANPGGQRYNINSTDEERRSAKNLMLLCYRHHKETDDVAAFEANALRSMKHQHESEYGQKPFKVNEAFLHRLESEMQTYWSGLQDANERLHVAPEFAVKLSIGTSAVDQFAEAKKAVSRLSEILSSFAEADSLLNEEIKSHFFALGYDLTAYDNVPYYRNPFFKRNWEMHALAANNTLTDLVVVLKQAEVRFLEEYVKTHSNEAEAIARLETAKEELHEMAVSTGYAD